jgi:signal transduction histidine kinase
MAERTTLLRARSVAERHPVTFDVVFGLLVGVLPIIVIATGIGPSRAPRALTAGVVLGGLAAAVLIVSRRRWPIPVFALATICALVSMATHGLTPVVLLASFICAATMATLTNRRTAWTAGLAAALVLYVGAVLTGAGWTSPESLGMVAWLIAAVAVGDALRSRRAYVAAIEERALRAEQTREEEARRRVVEERLRIARELHDVVAHHIALINVQAGVAAHVLRSDPDQAEDALAHVRKAARTVLDETSTLLGVLRRPDEPDDTEPTRGLARLGGLLDALGGAGLRVEHHQHGDARELPSAVDLAAFRIIQESLTNAQKHGTGERVRLELSYSPTGVGIVVSNPADVSDVPVTGGHGLVGMRERAAAVGGTLSAGPHDGRFVVEAFLPASVGSA